ncbi:hypothetical protein E3E14_11215 [Streptomyces sp. ICN441]|nr:hypothetical protein E3E14_11215 [Streptomyces sp. ICN441]
MRTAGTRPRRPRRRAPAATHSVSGGWTSVAASPCTRSCLPSLVFLLIVFLVVGVALVGVVLVGGGEHGAEESALEAYALGEGGLEGGSAPPSYGGTTRLRSGFVP